MATIYVLRDSTGAVRYVGVTTVPLRQRLREHRAHRNTTRCAPKLAAAMRAGEVFTIEAVGEVPYEGRMQAENSHAEVLRLAGVDLLNETAAERSARLSVAARAMFAARTPESIEKLKLNLVQFRR